MTPYAKKLLRQSDLKRELPLEPLSTKYPRCTLVYCPRKSGVVWMVRVRRENISEHKTKAEAVAALALIKKKGGAA